MCPIEKPCGYLGYRFAEFFEVPYCLIRHKQNQYFTALSQQSAARFIRIFATIFADRAHTIPLGCIGYGQAPIQIPSPIAQYHR